MTTSITKIVISPGGLIVYKRIKLVCWTSLQIGIYL